jgi:cell wall-associated NlpC family hydrolase
MTIDCTEYLQIPYKVAGRDRKGIDCYGLFLLVAKEKFGIDYFPDFRGRGGLLTGLYGVGHSDEVAAKNSIDKLDTPQDGCFVRMLGTNMLPVHCGIYINGGQVLHIDEIGTRVQSVAELSARILGYYGRK